MITRSGIGYDVHRLVPGDGSLALILGGISFTHPQGQVLSGHSDADVLCHAIADALLGAAGQRDIGHHFPNTDPAYRGISSIELLRRVVVILAGAGASIVNVDSTVIAEEPRIGSSVGMMGATIASALGIEPGCVGVKATTNEGLGFLGRGEGIAAMATASVLMAH